MRGSLLDLLYSDEAMQLAKDEILEDENAYWKEIADMHCV